MIAIRIPIAYAMIFIGGIGTMLISDINLVLNQLKTLAYGQFSIYSLSVIPMFVLMGSIASKTGISQALFNGANVWLGWLKGGTAFATIIACAGFGSVCGSSIATASTMSKIALPELKRNKYSSSLASGALAAGGVLGILIPPSIVLIIYSILVEANIIAMFMAAFIPAIMAVIMFLITISIYVRIFPTSAPQQSRPHKEEFLKATLKMIPILLIFILVIGGIYFGLFNPTPAAAIGVFLVFIHGLINKQISIKILISTIKETASISGMIYLIIFGAELLKIFFSRLNLPQDTAQLILNSTLSPMLVLMLILFALIVLGCFMDSLSMILLTIPFFWPVLVDINGGLYQEVNGSGFGMSTENLKIWFGILTLIVVELGLITPPVGINVFVISSASKDITLKDAFLGVTPFIIAELIRISILFAFPIISLWLPHFLQ